MADVDLSTFIPETFKGETGEYDTGKFRAEFDELSGFKASETERLAAMPKEATGYAWALPEDHAYPEGLDVAKFAGKDADGNEIAFDPSKVLAADDPDVPLLQAALLEAGAPPQLMSKLASIMMNRELRGLTEAMATADKEKLALGPQSDVRIKTVERSLRSSLPKEQADAIVNSITSADGLRGFEALLKKVQAPVSQAPAGKSNAEMSIDERIAYGLAQRKKA